MRTSPLNFLAMSARFSGGASRRRPRARTPTLLPYLTCARHDSEHGVTETTTTTTVTPRVEIQIAIGILTTNTAQCPSNTCSQGAPCARDHRYDDDDEAQ